MPRPAENALKKLIITFTGLALLLMLAGAVIHNVPLAQLAVWAQVAYWSINTITIFLAGTITAISWRRSRSYRFLLAPALSALISTLSQTLSAAFMLWLGSHLLLNAVYLLAAMLTLGSAFFLAVGICLPAQHLSRVGLSSQGHRFYFRSIWLAALGMLLLLLTGVLVSETETATACAGWPLCQGELFPRDFTLEVAINLLHRFTVVAVSVLIAAIILQTRRRYTTYPLLKNWATTLGFLFLAQVGLGGLYSFTNIPLLISALHLGLSIAIWGCLIVLAAISYFTLETILPAGETEKLKQSNLSLQQKAVTFFKLTKPWILGLLLITTITAMFIAARGLPPVALILYTLLGGILSAGGASVLNSYIDSDIDQVMSRTSRRATATGLVTPQETLLFGLALCVLSFLLFAIFVNLLSAILSTIGILYYVFFYTLYLKRTTIHNIIIGGAAGAIPPLVGWTAVTNTLDLSAFYLFAIIFFWTPPHTWALALLVKKDYAQARVPMLPVVVGEKETTYQIFLYSILLITLTLLPFTFHMLGWAYLIAALLLGARFIYLAWKLWRNYDKSLSKRLYKFSQAYLALLFLMMAIDRTLF